jgi:uncharacterized protein YndB with AHSA1/START domain
MDIPLVHVEVYKAPLEKVWEALTDEDAMRIWYFPQLIRFKAVVGFEFLFSVDGSLYQKEWQVTKVEAGRLFAHSWTYKGYPGRSEVIFEVFEERDRTRLKVTHTGLASFPNDPHFARSRFEGGWKQILGNLKNYLAPSK